MAVRTCWLALLANLLAAVGLHGQDVSLTSLLQEMVDRDQRSRFPDPCFTCRQFSSYDRQATSPANQDTWYANWDRSQFLRVEQTNERQQQVFMDAEGPGAIVRFWATWHGPGGGPFSNGTLRVFVDGSATPAIEGPMADILSGGALVGPPLSQGVAPQTEAARQGHNLYLPIPYARHCKVTYETEVPIDVGARQGEALYYQINYRTYPAGTSVRSFSLDELSDPPFRDLLAQVQDQLASAARPVRENARRHAVPEQDVTRQPLTMALSGPAAIRQLRFKLSADNLAQALRATVLEIKFDGEDCVWCPLGDFFGGSYRGSAFRSWYTQVTPDGDMSCCWTMPFQEDCSITLRNLSDQVVRISGQVQTGPWRWDERSMHFHAAWRQYSAVDTQGDKDMNGQGAFDVNYVTLQGEGVYVGDTLTVFNGASAWWGEGDEKIYVDGESFPSHFGTGTEDYYGYAWCQPAVFEAPFHAQPCGDGNLKSGYTVNSRYRGLDGIPFRRSLRFDMELWHWVDTKINFAPTTFWYARPGGRCNVRPDPQTALRPVALKRADVVNVRRVAGATEGESLPVVAQSAGTVEIQEVDHFEWSGDRQLWWRDAAPGDSLELSFAAPRAGTFAVIANLTKAHDYGQVKISINGKMCDHTFDRFATDVSHNEVELGIFELEDRDNKLVVEIVGSHPQAVKRYMFGLDYLKLQAK